MKKESSPLAGASQIVYKLTDQDGYTRRDRHNQCLWGPGVTHSGTGKGSLCGPGYIHAYTHPLLAVLLNPIHAGIENPRLWECETVIVKNDRGLKVGGVSLTTIKEIPLPKISIDQRVKFAQLCANYATEYEKRCKTVTVFSFATRAAIKAVASASDARYSARAAKYFADNDVRYADAGAIDRAVHYAANTARHAAAAASDAAAVVAKTILPSKIDFSFLIKCAEQAMKE